MKFKYILLASYMLLQLFNLSKTLARENNEKP